MDRVTVRSFRAPDLAERGLKELARSRLDTTREVVFQPLGDRFLDAREDPARIAQLLREDAFHAEEGHFTRMILRLPAAPLREARRPRAALVERRIEEATRDAASPRAAACAGRLPRAIRAGGSGRPRACRARPAEQSPRGRRAGPGPDPRGRAALRGARGTAKSRRDSASAARSRAR